MQRPAGKWAGALLGAALLAGCVLGPPPPDQAVRDAAIRAEAAATASAAVWATVAAQTGAEPAVAGETPALLSAAQIFQRLSPSVAYIDLPGGTGSGMLVAGGYVVTNAHVVWPYDRARIVFADGSEHLDVPVHNMDLLGDLALLGPLDTALPPVQLEQGEGLGVGEEVYLIGFPGEGERFPQPAIARGIISRMREWDALGVSYFQSDAAVAGGQSGGMLASPGGAVIGISGFSFAEGAFALAASAGDLEQRIARLAAGEDVDGLPAPALLGQGRRLSARFSPAHYYDQRMYLLQGQPGDQISVRAEGDGDLFLAVTDIFGEYMVLADEETRRAEVGNFTAENEGPYFVFAGPMEDPQTDAEISVRASQRLLAYDDADDGRAVHAGEKIAGQMDYPGDSDLFRLALDAGDAVRVRVESVLMDPYVTLDYAEAGPADRIHDDDSGGGLFGLNAEVVYTAPEAGEFWIVVEDSYGAEIGGYLLTVEAM